MLELAWNCWVAIADGTQSHPGALVALLNRGLDLGRFVILGEGRTRRVFVALTSESLELLSTLKLGWGLYSFGISYLGFGFNICTYQARPPEPFSIKFTSRTRHRFLKPVCPFAQKCAPKYIIYSIGRETFVVVNPPALLLL